MQLRENCKYALLAPTSMGLRLTPGNGQPVHLATQYFAQATSAESNVLSVAASLGKEVKVLTGFVQGCPISRYIQSELKRRGIAFAGPEYEKDGPWGVRHQINFADSGCGARAPQVTNDRAGEVGLLLRAEDFDLPRIFAAEGV